MKSLVGRTVADIERELILATLEHCRGNRTHAARMLGISLRTVRNKLRQFAEEDEPAKAPPPDRKGEPAVVKQGDRRRLLNRAA